MRHLLSLLYAACAVLAVSAAGVGSAEDLQPGACVTLKGAFGHGATEATVCADDAAPTVSLQGSGAALSLLGDDLPPYGADERRSDLSAEVIPVGARAVVGLSVRDDQEGLGANDCDFSSTASASAWAVHTERGWVVAAHVMTDSYFSSVRCREEPPRLEGRVEEVEALLLPLDVPTLFITRAKWGFGGEVEGPERLGPAETIAEVHFLDMATGAAVAADWTACPRATTPDPDAKGLRCLDADGKRHGPAREVNAAGVTTEQAWYHHGQRVGAYLKRHDSGLPKLVGLYDAKGLGQGVWVALHDSGIPRKLERFRDGKATDTLHYDAQGVREPTP